MLKETIFYILGFLSCIVVVLALIYGANESFPTGRVVKDVKISPSDRIGEEDIILYEDKIVILVKNASISNYASSGSMIPRLDKGSNGIRIVPRIESEIRVGAIVRLMKVEELIVHRFV